MPAKKRVLREDILAAAAEVIRQGGAGALTMRKIAAQLGCSTQPLYSEFGSQEQLCQALPDYLGRVYLRAEGRSYREFGQVFLRFAGEQPELFRFLYLRRRAKGQTALEDANLDQTLALLAHSLELDPGTAARMHRQMQYYCYGLGTMIATGYRQMAPEEIDQELTGFLCLLLREYKQPPDEKALNYWLERTRKPMLTREGGTYGKTQDQSL